MMESSVFPQLQTEKKVDRFFVGTSVTYSFLILKRMVLLIHDITLPDHYRCPLPSPRVLMHFT